MKVGFDFADGAMPRTIFYEKLCDAIRSDPRFDPAGADLVFPAEDTAIETNWPRYDNRQSAFLRGSFEAPRHFRYLKRLMATTRPLCIVNMVPTVRIALAAAPYANIMVADVNLLVWERAANPRTVSIPALPITAGGGRTGHKTVLAAFRGIASHPCRQALARLNNGTSIVVDIVARENHCGKIDAERGIIDASYADLLAASVFAFVPRGDAEFSYRLLEAMSFGCIPIVISDGLVLPFDRTIAWRDFSLHMPEQRIDLIPQMAASIPVERVRAMQRTVTAIYERYFSGFPAIARTLLDETQSILTAGGVSASSASR